MGTAGKNNVRAFGKRDFRAAFTARLLARIGGGVLGALALAAPARAEWIEAQSAHFVIYADGSQRTIARVSEQLERYHAALEFLVGQNYETPSPSNRVTVYVVNTEAEVRKLLGGGGQDVAGFYTPRAGSSAAFVPKLTGAADGSDWPLVVLRHEYAHHFNSITTHFPPPRWMSEGSAEFFASARNLPTGGIEIGLPAVHRAGELFYGRSVPAKALLDEDVYAKRKGGRYDAFYGRSWLLFHFLTFELSRAGQIKKYGDLLYAGKSHAEAGQAAFGDFQQLDRDLDSYLMRSRTQMLSLKPEMLKIGPTAIRALRPGEAAMMPVRIRSRRGVTPDQAKALLPEARAIATRFPGDAAVLAALSEAEHDAGNHPAAAAAAERALAIDSKLVDAHLHKARALLAIARESAELTGTARQAAYVQARDAFLALNRIEPDHPEPLFESVQIYLAMGRPLSPNMLSALERAVEVAPFDMGMRMSVALHQLYSGKRDKARANLVPVAFNPHADDLADKAKDILARMDAEPGWNGVEGS